MLNLNSKQYGSLIVSFYLIVTPAYALPTGEHVVHGNVKFKVEQNNMQITASDKSIINYKTFNIGSQELVKFIQPSSHAVVLNRVITKNPSNILGTLTANGRIFLINPSGIIFGKNSHINVNSLLATTLSISDKDFLNSNYQFSQLKNMPKSYIIQNGSIHVTNNGFVVLASPFVQNDGLIIAKAGEVHIGAVDNFYLNFDRKGIVMFSYNPDNSSSHNVILSKDAAQHIIKNVINTSKTQQPLKIVKENGVITLLNGSGAAIIGGKIVTSATKNAQAGKVNIVAQKFIELNQLQILANAVGNGNGGNINIFSNGSAYGSKYVLLSAKGGDISGNGGFIEFSAKKSVIMNGMQVDASALHGKSGIFYVDPEDILIQSNEFFNANPNFEATNSITLTKWHSLSSSKNTNISLYAPNITLEDQTSIKSGGDILLKTTSKDGKTIYNNVSINIGDGVELSGRNIDLEAISSDTAKFDPTILANYKAAKTIPGFLSKLKDLLVAYTNAKSSSAINIGNAKITATNDITINSKSFANADMKTHTVELALAVGNVNSSATVNLNKSILIADNNVTISSISNTVNHTEAQADNFFVNKNTDAVDTTKYNLALALSDTKTTATTIIDSNSYINSKNISIQATGYKDLETIANAGSYSDGVIGSAVSMSSSDSNVKAVLGGQAIASNNINVNAQTNINRLATESTSSVGNGLVKKLQLESLPSFTDATMNQVNKALTDEVNSKDSKANAKGSDAAKVALSAAVSYSNHTNTNDAIISKNSNVYSKNGDINVKSNIDYYVNAQFKTNKDPNIMFGYYGIKTSAITTIDSTDKNPKANSASGSVVITDITNNTNAYIDNDAVINSFNGDVNVNAQTSITYNINWDDFLVAPSYTTKFTEIPNFKKIGQNLIDNSPGSKTADAASFRTHLFTTFAQSNAQGTENAIAGTYNNFKLTNNTNAHIGEGVLINKDKSNSHYGDVSVIANNNVETINFAGIIGWLYFGTKGGNGLGVGGAYLKSTYTDNINAYVDSKSSINANAFNLQALKDGHVFSLATAGGKSKYAISGSLDDIINNDSVYAYVNQADIHTKSAANGNDVNINAQNELQVFNGSGGVTIGAGVGIGASVSRNYITRDTEAYITNNSHISSGNQARFNDNIESNNQGYIGAYTLSGAVATSNKTDLTTVDSDSKDVKKSSAGTFGVAISAESGLNYITDTAKAYVDHTLMETPDILNVTADNTTDYIGLSGGASLSIGSPLSGGLTGSYTGNYLTNTATAYVNNSSLHLNRINIDAYNSGNSIIYTSSLSGGTGVANLAGSVGIENLNNSAISYIENSDVSTYYNVNVKSLNGMDVGNYAGGVGITSGVVGVGASYISNDITNTTKSYIDSSGINVLNANNINVIATENGSIDTISVAGALAIKGIAASASIIKNNIQDDIESYISAQNATSNINGYDINVNALDNTSITADAGAVSGSKYAAVGGSFITNNISNKLNSYISQTTIKGSKLNLSAISDKNITGTVVGGSASIVAVSGSNLQTDMNDTVTSSITNSIINEDSIVNHAIEHNNINNKSGILAAGGAGIGASYNKIDINNTISATISTSTLSATGSVNMINPDITNKTYKGLSLLALGDENVTLLSANAAVGLGAFNGIVNNISINDNLSSTMVNSSTNSNLNGNSYKDDILIQSLFNDNVISKEGAFAITGTQGVGSSTNNININNSNLAYIKNSYAQAGDLLEVKAQGIEAILPKTVSGATGMETGAAGSLSIINVNNNNNVDIEKSTLLSHKDLNTIAQDTTLLGYKQVTKPSANANVLYGKYEQDNVLAGAAGIAASIPGESVSVGIGASIIVNHIHNTADVTLLNSKLNATEQTNINSQNNAYIINNVLSGALSTQYAGAGSIIINNISSTTHTFLTDTDINQNRDFVGTTQGVNIGANDYNDVNDTLGSAQISGASGLGASIDITTMHHSTSVLISHAQGSREHNNIFAKGNINIEAKSNKTFTSNASTYSISAFGGIGGSVIVANLDNQDLMKISNFKKVSGNTYKLLKKLVNNDNVFDGLFGTGEDDITNVKLDYWTNVNAGSNLNITAENKYTNTDISAGADTLGSAGAGVSLVYFGGKNKVFISAEDNLYANNINVNANYNISDIDSNNNVGSSNITSYNGLASIGGVALGAAYTNINETYNNAIEMDDSTMIAQNNISIQTNTTENINANAYGAIGAVSNLTIGGALANINSNSNKSLLTIGYYTKLFAKNNIYIGTNYSTNMKAYTKAAAINAGGASLQASLATITNKPYININLNGSIIESRQQTSIISSVTNIINATTDGVNWGGIAVGASKADVTFNPTSNLITSENIYANNVLIQNNLNINNGSKIANTGVFTSATASGGGLIGAVGAEASSTFNPSLTIGLYNNDNGNGGNIYALNNITIGAKAYINTSAKSYGRAAGFVAGGLTRALIDTSNPYLKTEIRNVNIFAKNNIRLDNYSNVTDNSVANGGTGGLFTVGGTQSYINTANKDYLTINGTKIVSDNGRIWILTTNDTFLTSNAKNSSSAGVAANYVKSGIDINDQIAKININNANIQAANELDIISNQQNEHYVNYAESTINAAGGLGTAEADMNSKGGNNMGEADVIISNTSLKSNVINLNAVHNPYDFIKTEYPTLVVDNSSLAQISISVAAKLKTIGIAYSRFKSNLSLNNVTYDTTNYNPSAQTLFNKTIITQPNNALQRFISKNNSSRATLVSSYYNNKPATKNHSILEFVSKTVTDIVNGILDFVTGNKEKKYIKDTLSTVTKHSEFDHSDIYSHSNVNHSSISTLHTNINVNSWWNPTLKNGNTDYLSTNIAYTKPPTEFKKSITIGNTTYFNRIVSISPITQTIQRNISINHWWNNIKSGVINVIQPYFKMETKPNNENSNQESNSGSNNTQSNSSKGALTPINLDTNSTTGNITPVNPNTESNSTTGNITPVNPNTESNSTAGNITPVNPNTESNSTAGNITPVNPNTESNSTAGNITPVNPNSNKGMKKNQSKQNNIDSNNIVNNLITPIIETPAKSTSDVSKLTTIYSKNFLNGVTQSIETNNLAVSLNIITPQQEATIINKKLSPVIIPAITESAIIPLVNPIVIPKSVTLSQHNALTLPNELMVPTSQILNNELMINNNMEGKNSENIELIKVKKNSTIKKQKKTK